MQITTYTLMQNKYHVMAAASSPKIGNLELHTLSSSPTPGEGSLLNWKIDSTTKRKLAIVLLLQVQQTSKVEKCARDRIMGIMNFVREAKTKQLFRSLCIEHSLLKRERTEIAKFQLHFLTQFCVLLKNSTYYFVDTRDTIKKLTLQQRRFQRKSSINRTTINTFQSNQESGVKGSRYIQKSSIQWLIRI